MTLNWRECVCRPSSPARLSNLNAYANAGPAVEPSAIDVFHDSLQKVLSAATPAFLAANPTVGPFFLGGIAATTEEFLRSLLGRLIAICPDAQAHSASKPIHLGSAVWHGQGVVARGALESTSLAGRDNVVKSVREFLDYQLSNRDRVWGVLDEYDKVCEIRHGAVHSGITFPGKNAVKLRLNRVVGAPRLSVGFAELQECADVCTALAVSLNVDLFSVFAERWATSWRQYPAWGAKSEHRHFKDLWDTFHSQYDEGRSLIAVSATMVKCRNAIKREFP